MTIGSIYLMDFIRGDPPLLLSGMWPHTPLRYAPILLGKLLRSSWHYYSMKLKQPFSSKEKQQLEWAMRESVKSIEKGRARERGTLFLKRKRRFQMKQMTLKEREWSRGWKSSTMGRGCHWL